VALLNKSNESGNLEGQTPATVAVAIIFFMFVLYFIIEQFFTAIEYYAEDAPYLILIIGWFFVTAIVFIILRKVEPERKDTLSYALLAGFGMGLALYSFIPRINILTDEGGIKSYSYLLDTDYMWKANEPTLPELDLYLKSSRWWKQYKPGDTYIFNLRKGGLGIWQVNMEQIYNSQKKFYDCDGVLTCMTK